MAYQNYGMAAQPTQQSIPQPQQTGSLIQPYAGQNVQPLFPQPQGNVYNINSTLKEQMTLTSTPFLYEVLYEKLKQLLPPQLFTKLELN